MSFPMRRLAPALLIPALFAAPALGHAGALDLILGKRDLEVITVTDLSSTGNFVPAATPENPQYYVAASLGYRDLGGYMAGIEAPPSEVVLHLISAELAKQGYVPSTAHSPAPTLMLVYTWGTLNAENLYGGDPSAPPTQLNRGQIVRFLGGQKVGMDDNFFNPLTAPIQGLSVYNFEAERILDVARESFYVIVVSAYDIESALQKKRLPPLWTTRIAAPSLGFAMGDVFPAMLAIGGAQFGRETPRPVWINANDKFTPSVTLGELRLVEYLQDSPLPVADVSDAVIEKK
jgi:hypothetical protein